MKQTKKQFKYFSLAQYKQEQDYLQKMHRNGWKLTHISCLSVYHFEKCTPEDVVYQLDFQTEVTDQSEYIQMFQDCGWEYLLDCVGYSYFRKPVAEMDGPEEIFCDDESRLDMMRRIYKKRMVPLIIMFFCCIIPQLLRTIANAKESSLDRSLSILFVVAFMLYIVSFVTFGIQFFQYKRDIKRG